MPYAAQTKVGSVVTAMRRVGRHRAWATSDALTWFMAVVVCSGLRQLYVVAPEHSSATLPAAIFAALLHVAVSVSMGLYRRGQIQGTYGEIVLLGRATFVVSIGLLLASAVVPDSRMLPSTVAATSGLAALTTMLSTRLVARAYRMRRMIQGRDRTPVLVFGGGSAGRLLVHTLLYDHDSPHVPVAVLDDDPSKRALRIDGVKVKGGRDVMADVAARHGADRIVIAIPSADSATIRELHDAAELAGLKTLVLPPFHGLLEGRQVRASDIRDINLEDLLGRRTITLDECAITEEINGATVLVTGAGGSIGSELCRQLVRFGVGRLVMLDRDESAMHALQLELEGNGLLDSETIVLADIRDPGALREAFARHRPRIVFHAAALKHLPLLQRYPHEAWLTNVLGTLNVLQAAADHQVGTFVNISTDKAADPQSVLGYSKRVAERLTADFAQRYPGRYMSVRFGNVLGSRGSVVPTFTEQIRRGGPVTVTHPDVTRYFMLIPEACQLVLQGAAIGRDGEVLVLDMGQPVKIVDVAQTLIDLLGHVDVEIRYTGLRPGEKLEEELFAERDGHRSTSHPLVVCTDVPSLAGDLVRSLDCAPPSATLLMRHFALGHDVDGHEVDVQDPHALVSVDAAGQKDLVEYLARQSAAAGAIVERVAGSTTARPAGPGEPGSEPLDEPIYLSKADTGPLEEEWVLKALRSGYVAPLGPMIDEFEKRVAERVGVGHALALTSGTAALHLALLHVGARPGTHVVVPTMTFAATANAVMYTGATPVFVDVQSSDGNVDVDLAMQAIDGLQADGKQVVAMLPVDLFGRCADYTRLEPELALRGVPLIEDAAEALGATHGGRGAGSFGLAGVLSFNGNKIMTTSGGGMLLSNDGDLIDHARYLSTQARQPVPWYEHVDVGYNYRMSNVLAGLGIAQLSRLDDFIARRREIRDLYEVGLIGAPGIRIMGRGPQESDADDNCWLTSVVFDAGTVDVDSLVARMSADRIECRHLWKPLHLMAAYAGAGSAMTGASERLFGSGVNLPSGVGLRDEDVDRTLGAVLEEVLQRA